MDAPPPYNLSSSVTLGYQTYLSHAGRLLVISSPVGTEIHIVPDGMYTAEVNYMHYQSVSIDISTMIPNQVPIQSRVSCLFMYYHYMWIDDIFRVE